jgi:hypothetical protein
MEDLVQTDFTDTQVSDFVHSFAQSLDLQRVSKELHIPYSKAVALKDDPRFRDKFAMVALDALKTNILSPQSLLTELCAIAFHDVTQVMDYNNGTPRLKSFDDMDSIHRKAIKSITVREGKFNTKVTEVTFYDKMSALKELSELFLHTKKKSGDAEKDAAPSIDGWVTEVVPDNEPFSV